MTLITKKRNKKSTKGQRTTKFTAKNIIYTVITTAYTRTSTIDEMVYAIVNEALPQLN